jgi:hypothetical protein
MDPNAPLEEYVHLPYKSIGFSKVEDHVVCVPQKKAPRPNKTKDEALF